MSSASPSPALDDVTGAIVDAAYRVHVGLGPGLLETVYRTVLARELERRSLHVEIEKQIQLVFDGVVYERAFRADLIVARCVIVEVKSRESLAAVHTRQLLTYLRLTNLRVGLLINFGAVTLKQGLRRLVNDLPSSASPRLLVNRGIQED